MRFLSFGLLFVFVLSSFAATPKTVSYKSGDDTVQSLLYSPEGRGPFPDIVVIHEWWGLSDWVKQQASNLADQGYVTLAIDLYRGQVATTPEQAHELMRGVPEDRAAQDLNAAVAFLKSRPDVKKSRIGAIGWCMGGGYALNVALQEPALAADVIHYGHLATTKESLQKIHAPVLGVFGGKDQGISVEDVKKFEASLKAMGRTVEIHIYPEAGHGFENPVNPSYRAEDAADAWQRTVLFLAATLKK
jgi:carboxymethylenebutenolidase